MINDRQKIFDKIYTTEELISIVTFRVTEMKTHFYNYILVERRKLKKGEIYRKKRQKSNIFSSY